MAKAKQTVMKRTYRKDELNILLLQESFRRDLPLFQKLVSQGDKLFGQPIIGDGWTFTVVRSDIGQELVINVPPKK